MMPEVDFFDPATPDRPSSTCNRVSLHQEKFLHKENASAPGKLNQFAANHFAWKPSTHFIWNDFKWTRICYFRGCLFRTMKWQFWVINWRVRHGKKNICRGFHLLFPFSSSPISKAIMSEDERGKHWGIYIIYSSYIYIKMDLVQPTIRNLLKQSPTRGTTLPRAKKTNLKMRSESLRTTTSLPGKTEWAFPQLWTTQCAEFQISPNRF